MSNASSTSEAREATVLGDATLPTAERWQRLEALFHEASELPESERAGFLAESCGDDLAMRDQLWVLLGNDSSIHDLMAVAIPAEDHLTRDSATDPGKDAWIGRTLDGFQVVSLLGRGGMGVVYLGERLSQKLTQRVAIKLIARHLRSSPALNQFRMEREALATMEHPNIARLVGGGVTTEGIPFVLMEYIEGIHLDTASDDAAVSLKQIIGWILQLCDAVSYAHENLILHRDLKPGNVMVTPDGSVKLLDFGTLKGMGKEAADSDMTQFGMRAITRNYASPEHILGRASSTGIDVYSLGMILYRVLAGRLPDVAATESLPAYLEALESGGVPPPSSYPSPGRGRTEKELSRDLDAITLKAIRFDPADRYASVEALRADLLRAMESRPVSARAGHLPYVVRQFTRRHALPVLAAMVAALLLVVGLTAAARQARIARAESRRAEAGIAKERTLEHFLLFDYFERLKQVPASTAAQHVAVQQALNYLDGLGTVPTGSDLELDKIQAYTEMGVLLGDSYEENLGDTDAATRTLQKILPEALLAARMHPDDLKRQQAAAAVQTSLGQVYNSMGRAREARQYLLPAGATSLRIAASPKVTLPMLIQAGYVLNSEGDVYGQHSDYTVRDVPTSIRIFMQGLQVNQQALVIDPACVRCRSGVALAYWKLGMMAREDDVNRAASYYRDGLASLAALSPQEQATTRIRRMDGFIRHRLGEAYLSGQHPAEAVQLLEESRKQFQVDVAADKLDLRPRWDLGPTDFMLGEGYEALHEDRKALEAYCEYADVTDFLVRHNPQSATYQNARAEALLSCGRLRIKLGQQAAGQQATAEGLSLSVATARKPAAQTNELQQATEALVSLHQNPAQDAALALSFAEREVASSKEPQVDQIIDLAQAQRYAGLGALSKVTAEHALKLQSLHPNGLDSVENMRGIRQLLN